MLNWIAQNTVVALGIAGAAVACSVILRRKPAACHVLWLCTLIALLAPPLPRHEALNARTHAQRMVSRAASGLSAVRAAIATEGPDSIPTSPPNRPLGGAAPLSVAPSPAAPGMEARARLLSKKAESEPEPGAAMAALEDSAPVKAEDAVWRSADEPAKASHTWTGRTIAGAPEDLAASLALPTPAPIDWAALGGRVFLLAWLTGAVGLGARLGRDVLRVGRLVRAASRPERALAEAISETARSLGAPPPRVRVSPDISTPFVWGAWRPTLVWPAGESLDGAGARTVLAHELAHVARRDHWVAWFEALAACVLWWHPLAHLARRELRRHAERACDAWVVWAYPESRRDYADALLDAIERLSLARSPATVLGAVDSDRRSLTRRLMMIMNENVARRGSRLLALGAIAMTAALAPTWAVGGSTAWTPSTAVRSDVEPPLRERVEAARLEWEAEVYANGGDAEREAGALRTLTELRPDDAELWSRTGIALYGIGEYAEAARAFGVSAALDRADPDTVYNQACCLALAGDADAATGALELALRRGYADGGHAEGDDDLESLWESEAFRDLASRIHELGELHGAAEEAMGAESWAEAAAAFESAATLAPECAELQHYLGFTSFRAGEAEAARRAFERAIELGYAEGTCLYNLACVAAADGRADEALAYLDESIAAGFADQDLLLTDPDLKPLHDLSGFDEAVEAMGAPAELQHELEAAVELGEWASAAAKAEAYLAAVPEGAWSRPWALDQLGIARFRAGDFEGAEEAFTRAAAAGYDLADSLYNIACTRAQAGDVGGAIDYLGAAVEAGFGHAEHMRSDEDLAPLHEDPRFEAIARYAADREVLAQFGAPTWQHLLEKSEREIAEDPEDGAAHLRLGWALLRTDRTDEAMIAFERQAELEFAPGIARYNVACCHAIEGRIDKAFAAIDAAVRAGFDEFTLMADDPDLANLRGDPRFEKLVGSAEHKDKGADKTEKPDPKTSRI